MSQELNDFFSAMNEEDQKKSQEILNNTSSVGNEVISVKPGKYIMRVASIVGQKKEGKPRFVSPSVFITTKKSLMLKLVLEVDEATDGCPEGASVYHNIVLLPAKGADDKKIKNVFNMMKPQLSALLGTDTFDITKKFIMDNLTISIDEAGKIISDHAMKEKVFVTVDEVFNEYTNQIECKVKNLRSVKPGDKSETMSRGSSDNTLPFKGKEEGEGEKVEDVNTEIIDESADESSDKGTDNSPNENSVDAKDLDKVEDF